MNSDSNAYSDSTSEEEFTQEGIKPYSQNPDNTCNDAEKILKRESMGLFHINFDSILLILGIT